MLGIFGLSLYAEDIPEELQKIGFTQYTLVDYDKQGDTEYFTFTDWRTTETGDTVTFVILDGKVKEWFKKIEIWGNGTIPQGVTL